MKRTTLEKLQEHQNEILDKQMVELKKPAKEQNQELIMDLAIQFNAISTAITIIIGEEGIDND